MDPNELRVVIQSVGWRGALKLLTDDEQHELDVFIQRVERNNGFTPSAAELRIRCERVQAMFLEIINRRTR